MEFIYKMPTKIYFGENVIMNNKDSIKDFGNKALIVTGKHSSKINGSFNDVINALKYNCISYVVFDEVEENPSLETIERAAEIGRKEKVDFVIGIGGGSPLDASKAIGIFIKNESYNKENIFNAPKLKSIPIIAVATTSGTGSEVTQYSVVTDHNSKTKRNLGQHVFPDIAFLDPSYTAKLPYDITINTAIDAFSHLIEGYLNANSNILSDIYAEKGMSLFSECIQSLINNEINYEIRKKLMATSTLGGMLIAQTGTSIPHGMGYPLTYFKKLPHGKANGLLIAEYLNSFNDKNKICNILKIMNLESIENLKEILKTLLKVKIDISENEICKYSKAMAENKEKLKNHPEQINYEDIYKIYYNSLIDIVNN